MTKRFVQIGNVLTLIAPTGGVTSGMVYKIGALIVIALGSAAEGDEFEGDRRGVHTLPKTAANVVAQGVKAYLNAAGTEITTVAAGGTLVGVFVNAQVNGDTEADVLLTGQVV